jgi:hypothetical protein
MANPEIEVHTDARLLRLVGPRAVPMSDRRYRAGWAFMPSDALTQMSNPAVTPGVLGTTQIFAKTKDERIELATYWNPSGRLVTRTRTRRSDDGKPENDITDLVRAGGGYVDQAAVQQLRLENELYASETFEPPPAMGVITAVTLTPAPRYPSTHDAKGNAVAVLFGQSPTDIPAGGQVQIANPTVKGEGKTRAIDGEHRFVVWCRVAELFEPGDPQAELQLTIFRSGTDTLRLTYRLCRTDTPSVPKQLPGGQHTARAKLMAVSHPSIKPAAVPPLYLMLS